MSAALAVGRGAFGRMTPDPLYRPMHHGARSEPRRGFRLPRRTATVTVGTVARSLEARAVAPGQPQGLTPAAGGACGGRNHRRSARTAVAARQPSAEEGGGTQHPVLAALWWLSGRPTPLRLSSPHFARFPPRLAALRPRITQHSRGW
jgi:hypothetical protein